jgi:glycosyl hydrolase family 2
MRFRVMPACPEVVMLELKRTMAVAALLGSLLLALGCATTRARSSADSKPARSGSGPDRARLYLDGRWELHATPDDPAQAELAALKTARWHRISPPFSLSNIPGLDRIAARKVHYAWARKRFTARSETEYRNAVLHLHGISWGAKVWVNGQEVGEHLGGYGAHEYDITDTIKWGQANEVLVRITGWPKVPRSARNARNHNRKVPLIAHGPALFNWGAKQPRFHGRMWIDYFDYARLERVRIVAGTDGRVRVHGLSRNWTRNYGKREVRARILRNGREVANARANIPRGFTALSPRTPFAFTMETRVPRPELWSPDAPRLYRAELQLVQDGRVLDNWTSHFGFRSFEVRNGGLYLNGKRTFLRGVCFWGEGARWRRGDPEAARKYFIDLPRAANVRVIRHHTIPVDGPWLDLADRHGMMLLQEFPVTVNYIRPNFTPEELAAYRRNVISEFRTMLPLYWNHPSVIMWVPTNESPRDNAKWENGPLQALFKTADPTRPVMRSSEESDDIYDTHCYAGWWSGSEGQFALACAEGAKRGRARGKPIGNTEYVENFSGGRVTKWMGERPKTVSKEAWATRRRDLHAQTILEQSEVLRRLGYDVTLPYAWGGGYLQRTAGPDGKPQLVPQPNFYALRSAMAPTIASIDLADRHFVTGEELELPLVICDDSGSGRSLRVKLLIVRGEPGFRWPSARAGLEVVSSQTVKIPAGKRGSFAPRRKGVKVVLPARPGRYHLLAVTPQGKEFAAVSRRVLHVVPRPAVERLNGRKVALLAVGKQLKGALKGLLPGARLDADLAAADVLIVGPFAHSVLKTPAATKKKLAAFAARGGRVLVLEQDRDIPPLGLELPRVQAQGGSSTAFRSARRNFRAWRDLGRDDRVLRRMNGASGALVRRPLTPAKGDEVLLKAAQRGSGLNWAVVVRRSAGKGEMIFCQIPLHRHLAGKEADPVAQTIMVNLLAK